MSTFQHFLTVKLPVRSSDNAQLYIKWNAHDQAIQYLYSIGRVFAGYTDYDFRILLPAGSNPTHIEILPNYYYSIQHDKIVDRFNDVRRLDIDHETDTIVFGVFNPPFTNPPTMTLGDYCSRT